MDKAEFKNRMISAAKELSTALDRDYYKFVINDSVENATEQVNILAKMDEQGEDDSEKARELAEQLYTQTKQLIDSLD
jgi:guanylate kinase